VFDPHIVMDSRGFCQQVLQCPFQQISLNLRLEKGEIDMKSSLCVLALLSSVIVTGWQHTVIAAQDAEAAKPSGQVPYDRVCKVCHGPEGRGDAAPRLVPFDRAYEEVAAIVRDGRGEMPPVSTRRLSDDELKQIVEYLHSLAEPSEKQQ
jgi:mono/diheme cytochrome c family protein